MTDPVEEVAEIVEETPPSKNGEKVFKAITDGGALPPEPPHPHGGGPGKPPSDGTVIVLSALYIAGGLFMIGLGVTALRAMQKRRKERGK